MGHQERSGALVKTRPFLTQRVTSPDDPTHHPVIVRVRKAARRSFWNVDVRIEHRGHADDGLVIQSISSCWIPRP
jgi:hypothetical protein